MGGKSLAHFATTSSRVLIAPSILAANFSKLGQEIRDVENFGADLLHIDIMDGHFVPNLSMGPSVIKAIRPLSNLSFDVHLMLSNPSMFIRPFHEAGADHITFHVESNCDVESTISSIRKCGCSVGISLKPDTPEEVVFPFLEMVDLVLVMTVEPGFGGQSFRMDTIRKIKTIRNFLAAGNYQVHLQVDGGITTQTSKLATEVGANILVAGTCIFKAQNGIKTAIEELRNEN